MASERDPDATEPEKPDDEVRDPEGESLAAEIAADRRLAKESRRRFVLYLPPLASLVVAAAALALSHPRVVVAARIIGGAAPVKGSRASFAARAIVVQARPGDEGGEVTAAGIELRIGGAGAKGTASVSDDEGVAELSVEAPLPARFDVEGKLQGAFARLATVSIEALPPPDPSASLIPVKRTLGESKGELVIDVAPEHGALDPPEPGALWVHVRTQGGDAVAGANVELEGEAGLTENPKAASTDEAGLVKLVVEPSAPPILVHIHASKGAAVGDYHGAIGAYLGVPIPSAQLVAPDAGGVDFTGPRSLRRAFYDVFHDGLRVGGGVVVFPPSTGPLPVGVRIPLPREVGLYDVEVSTSPMPSNTEDLIHAATFPVVAAADAIDAWAQLTTPRIHDRISPALGAPSTYPSVVAATLAAAPVAVPPRRVLADGLPAAMAFEVARIKRVRHGATFAIVGGGLVELGLMLGLGVFTTRRRVEDELRAMTSEGELSAVVDDQSRGNAMRLAAIVVTSIGVIALVFAGLAIMAWGLPGLS